MAEHFEESEIPTISEPTAEEAARRRLAPQIEGYEVLGEFPRGGMGVVWRARDTRLDRLVAIKTLLLGETSSDELRLLQQEASLAAQLHHPNIVGVYEFLPDTEPPCLIMELVDGVPIDEAARAMSYQRKAALLAKIARAVAHAHDRSIIHRDLKPGNILVDQSGEPRILDFGLAKRDEPTRNQSGSIKGTPLYMSPEQVLSPRRVGPSTDIYSLGLVLFELITGSRPPRPPDTGDSESWARWELPLPREIRPDIPEALQRICLTACEKEAENRYLSARHLANDLERFMAGEPIAARPRRYSRLLEDRVRSAVDDLALWASEGLITSRERDALEDSYVRVAKLDSTWIPGARRVRWGPTIAHLGGWLLVLAPLLWLRFYWFDLARWQRVAGVAAPTLVVNLVGALMWRHKRVLLGTIFCAVGALLVPVFFVVLFSECDLFELRQTGDYELLRPPWFCNVQLALGLLLGWAYSLLLSWRTRLGVYSILAALMSLSTYGACLLLCGLKDQLTGGRFASAACWFLPIPVGCYLVAHRFDRKGADQLAVAPYVLGGLVLVAITSVLAFDIPKSWMAIDGENQRRIASSLLFMASSVLYFGLGLLNDRSSSRIRRIWGRWLFRLVPFLFVIPLGRLEQPLRNLGVREMVAFTVETPGREAEAEARAAGTQGDLPPVETTLAAVYWTEILVFVACWMFVALAVVLQWRWYLYYGLIHSTVHVVSFTDKHLQEYVSWPAALLIAGTLIMLTGMAVELRFGRATRRPTP